MRFQYLDVCAEGVVKTVASRFDPEHYPNDREIEKENNVRDPRVGERDRDNGGAAGNRPVSRDIEPLPPNHNPPHFTAIKMRHRVYVAGIVEASLERNRRLFVYGCY